MRPSARLILERRSRKALEYLLSRRPLDFDGFIVGAVSRVVMKT
jgi:hypothetical protein